MNSLVAIWNIALTEIGKPTLLSPVDDREEARACAAQWDHTRLSVLNAHHWNCATGRAQLAPTLPPPAFGYENCYQLPADFLRFKNAEDRFTNWTIEGRKILTDDGPVLEIVYIKDVTDPSQMDPLLKSAMAMHLAAGIAMKITGSQQLAELMLAKYERVMAEARYADSLQSQDRMRAETLQNSRFSGNPRMDGW